MSLERRQKAEPSFTGARELVLLGLSPFKALWIEGGRAIINLVRLGEVSTFLLLMVDKYAEWSPGRSRSQAAYFCVIFS